MRKDVRPLLHPGTVWVPAGPGTCLLASLFFDGQPRCRTVPSARASVLAACDGRASVPAIAARTGLTAGEVASTLEWFTGQAPAGVMWLPESMDPERGRHIAAAAAAMQAAAHTRRSPGTGAARFYRRELTSADANFDRHEATIAHVLADGHPLLGGAPYGARLASRLLKEGACRPGMKMLEIGAGLGTLAARFLDHLAGAAPDIYATMSLTIVDLSPLLIGAQRETLREHGAKVRWLQADVEDLELEDGALDLVVCNEVIADLPVEFAGDGAINAGAIRLVERLSRWLASGGRAWLSEYGDRSAPPQAVQLSGHTEYSIRFNDLLHAAERAGVEAECQPLPEWMGMEEDVEVLHADDSVAIATLLMPALGVPEPRTPWMVTRERLAAWLGANTRHVRHQGFFRVAAPDIGFSPKEFWVLGLRRPSGIRR